MDNLQSLKKLDRLASRLAKQLAGKKEVVIPFTSADLASALRSLVPGKPGGDSWQAEMIVGFFFTREAVDLLISLPNLHWCWTLIEKAAAACRLPGGPALPLDAPTLHRAAQTLQNAMAREHNLKLTLDQLTLDETWERLSEGVLVTRMHGEERPPSRRLEIVVNPIFAYGNEPWWPVVSNQPARKVRRVIPRRIVRRS